jgi:hypothetical protein
MLANQPHPRRPYGTEGAGRGYGQPGSGAIGQRSGTLPTGTG